MTGRAELPPWERDPLGQYLVVADAELAGHVATCAACGTGRGCPVGDNAAEAEARAYDRYRDASPDDARAYRDDQFARWSAA